MTLRTIETEFAKQLLDQIQQGENLDLSLNAPLMTGLHPKLLWAKIQHELNPEQELPEITIPNWNYQCFETENEARIAYPEVKSFLGQPWAVANFLNSSQTEAIINFAPIGAVLLSKNALPPNKKSELHEKLLPLWLHYALSPELWGSQGKWTRFDSRLKELLKSKKLIKSEGSAGYYELTREAQKLETHGFKGTSLDQSYLLVLSWTFSLTSLEKLESAILQEF